MEAYDPECLFADPFASFRGDKEVPGKHLKFQRHFVSNASDSGTCLEDLPAANEK